MLAGVNRLIDLAGTSTSGFKGLDSDALRTAVQNCDTGALQHTTGHFASVAREGQTVRMARTIGIPLRYFVAKMFHGPFLVVADRIDTLYDWCCSQKIGWQFDPMYTRMVPAHYLVELDQIGCPDPAPRCHRFFNAEVGNGPADIDALGDAYVRAAYESVKTWLEAVPDGEPIGLAFSGGVDSSAVLLLARHAMTQLGKNPDTLRAFTLDLGGGKDAEQAETSMRDLGLEAQWERISVDPVRFNLENAIRVIEDYHPLDVECAAASLCLLEAVRGYYPEMKYLLDGDGGDENLKSYPLEDSDLTLSSILRNPLLYQEGWGLDAIKHSLTYSGGLSRSYVRTYAPAKQYGFEAFSPFSTRDSIAAAVSIPFDALLDGSTERLYTLKSSVVCAGVKAVTGIDMPVYPKRRFQDGAGGETYRRWKVNKSWCRQVFLKQWEQRLSIAWDPQSDRMSGNAMPAELSSL